MPGRVNPHHPKKSEDYHNSGDARKELANAELTENFITPQFIKSVDATYKELHADHLQRFSKDHQIVHKKKYSKDDLGVAKASRSIIHDFGHSSYAKAASSFRKAEQHTPHKAHKPHAGS